MVEELVGYLAGICTAVCFLPQTIKTIRSGDTKDLSLLSYVIYSIGMLSWIYYGAYLHSLQMILFNGISLVFTAIILYKIIRQKLSDKA